MTDNFKFSDEHFPANGKPPPVFFTWKDKKRQSAWWAELNRRKERGNRADGQAKESPTSQANGIHSESYSGNGSSSLADEIAAAKREHAERAGGVTGEQPQVGEIPLYGTAEDTSAQGTGADGGPEGGDDAANGLDAAIAALAAMSVARYEQVRRDEAARLGVRAAILDKLVAAARPRDNVTSGQGTAPTLYEPEPWTYPVDGAELLDEIVETIRTYAVVTIEQARTAALWIVASHSFPAFRIFPRLLIKAPNSDCGKSTLKKVIGALVTRALGSDNASTAFIFRIIELSKPTLLLDEGDAFIRDDEERRGILDSGHHKFGSVGRVVGEDMEPRTFSTYCPAVVATIGSLPVTIENRSLIIGMVRKLPSERVVRFTDSRADRLRDGLACKVARFAADSFEKLAAADPVISEDLSNRKGDNWRPLFAVADLAGGEWPALARSIAAGVIAAGGAEDETTQTMLLSDLRDMFEALKADGDLFGAAFDTIIPSPFGSTRPIEQRETDRARSEHVALYLNSLTGHPWAAGQDA